MDTWLPILASLLLVALTLVIAPWLALRRAQAPGRAMARMIRRWEETGVWPERPPRETSFRSWEELQEAWANAPEEVRNPKPTMSVSIESLPWHVRWRVRSWHWRIRFGMRAELWMMRRTPWLWNVWRTLGRRFGWYDRRSRGEIVVLRDRSDGDGTEHP